MRFSLLTFLTIAASTINTSKADLDAHFLKPCLTSLSQSPAADLLQEAQTALEAGADINARDERSGQTCLMAATLRGNVDLVRFLIAKGADVTIPERSGFTPPHGAGFQGRADVMKILKEEAGIDVLNAPHEDGFLPFHRACWGNQPRHAETVEYLISLGADVNKRGGEGKDLTCMEMTKNADTVAILKKHGAIGEPKSEL
uniref:Uncharacterized protein n=1 Tax=Ditylum brightwellii TaxID=49249 RepID=A0A7S2EME0_9STRA